MEKEPKNNLALTGTGFEESYDYTMLSTFETCRRKYYYRIVRGIVGKKPPTAAEFGRCIHMALDSWFVHGDRDAAIKVFLESYKEDPEDEKRTCAVGKKLLELYFEKYAREPFKILLSEKRFSLPVPVMKANIIGRIDKIIDWDNVIYVMDHKTTSKLGYEFFNKIKPNMQFDIYIWAAQQLGYKAQGILLDALLVAKGLVTPAQLAKLTPLARLPDIRSEQDILDTFNDVRDIIRDIRDCKNTGIWRRNTESCCDYSECPYRKICKEEEAIRERVIDMDYKVEEAIRERVIDMDYKVEVWDPLKETE